MQPETVDAGCGHGLRNPAMWKSTLAQLTQAEREKITQFRDDGMTMTAIAKRFGVSIPTISRLLDEKSDVGQKLSQTPPASD
jgi:IS30 family transposase